MTTALCYDGLPDWSAGQGEHSSPQAAAPVQQQLCLLVLPGRGPKQNPPL